MTTSIVSSDDEPMMTERAHEGETVPRHRALGVRFMRGVGCRLGGLAVATQIRAHHRPRLGKLWCNPVPCGVCAGMAVQQQEARSGSAMPYPQAHLADADMSESETVEPRVLLFGHTVTVPASGGDHQVGGLSHGDQICSGQLV